MRIFMDMEESEVSRVFNNKELGYWNVTVERPLRLRVYPDRRIPRDVFKKAEELQLVIDGIKKASEVAQLDDWDAFAKATRLKKT
jgi:N-6 DNA methylase